MTGTIHRAAIVAKGRRVQLFVRRQPRATLGFVIVSLILATAIFAPLIAPSSFDATNLLNSWAPPGGGNILGTDDLGRDIASRLIYGARTTLIVSFSVLSITVPLGVAAGLVTGYFGGYLDMLFMRAADIILAFPEVVLAILVAAVLEPGMRTVIVAISIVWWPGIARYTRSLVIVQRSELYIDAAIVSGTSTPRILFWHLLPNILPAIVVRAAVGVGHIMMAEATLSFIGLGIQEPRPSWGSMIHDGLSGIATEPTLAISASLAMAVTVVGFNLLGDGIRDLLDHRLRDR